MEGKIDKILALMEDTKLKSEAARVEESMVEISGEMSAKL